MKKGINSYFEICTVVSIIKNWSKLSKIGSKELIVDYIKFIKKDF
ncbi:hypothetical protein [Desnuesiella massiliensis]|nr:hypothetical protein [Desnuesiella massiliensis]